MVFRLLSDWPDGDDGYRSITAPFPTFASPRCAGTTQKLSENLAGSILVEALEHRWRPNFPQPDRWCLCTAGSDVCFFLFLALSLSAGATTLDDHVQARRARLDLFLEAIAMRCAGTCSDERKTKAGEREERKRPDAWLARWRRAEMT